MKNYGIGITIGPIASTINMASSMGQLWGTSYLFSYISKTVKENLEKGELSGVLDCISPHIDENEIKQNGIGIGCYPDRLYYAVGNVKEKEYKINDIEIEVKSAVECTYNKLSNVFENGLKHYCKGNCEKEDYLKYVKQYFYIYYIICEIEGGSKISRLNDILNNLEYRVKAPLREEENKQFTLELTDNNNSKKEGSLFIKAFGKNIDPFPSITSITRGLWNADELEAKEEDRFKKGEKVFKPLNYYALVRADGDGIGKLISKGNADVKEISKMIAKFSIESAKEIKKYGGFTFYAGGDDLLFVAPVIKLDGENITDNVFNLINGINKLFKEIVKYENTSVSFGVTLMYHKHPLYEALEESAKLLFTKAKKFNGKNCVAIKLQAHSTGDNSSESGVNQETTVLMGLNNEGRETWEEFLKLMKFDDEKVEEGLRMSYQGKFLDYVKVLEKILNNNARIKAWMKNTFPADVGKWHYDAVCNLLSSISKERESRKITDDIVIKTILDTVSILKIARFMREKEVWDNE